MYIPKTETCPIEQRNLCGFRCDQVCHSWKKANYQCLYGQYDECCLTCGQEVNKCAAGMVLRDASTCVKPQDCPCILQNGNILAVSHEHIIHLFKKKYIKIIINNTLSLNINCHMLYFLKPLQ